MNDADRLSRALGSDHPLTRTQQSVVGAAAHVRTCVVVVAGAAVLTIATPEIGRAIGGAAVVVGGAMGLWVAVARHVRRERIHDLILAGDPPRVPVVAREVDRLCHPRNRASLAATLERAVDAGERWSQLLPASRPPPAVRNLHPHALLIRGDRGSTA